MSKYRVSLFGVEQKYGFSSLNEDNSFDCDTLLEASQGYLRRLAPMNRSADAGIVYLIETEERVVHVSPNGKVWLNSDWSGELTGFQLNE